MGTRISFSNSRRLVGDVLRLAHRFPSAGLQGEFDAGEVAKLRRLTRPKIAWNVLYMKAYAIVAANNPALRQLYVGFPRPHLYQHDDNVCMLTLIREHEGEQRLFFARFNNPNLRSLTELQAHYDHLRKSPVNEIKQFRHQINFAKTPSFLRRIAWWVMFNAWPQKRASHVGTYALSISGFNGSYGHRHLGPVTTILGFDPLPRKGISRLMVTFDHRVMDGVPASEILRDVQRVLLNEIQQELLTIIESKSAQPEFQSENQASFLAAA